MEQEEIEHKINTLFERHIGDREAAYYIVSEAFQQMKDRGIPTLIMFKEVEKLSQYLAIDFLDGYGDEVEAMDILGSVVERNEKEVEAETIKGRVMNKK